MDILWPYGEFNEYFFGQKDDREFYIKQILPRLFFVPQCFNEYLKSSTLSA